MKCFFCFSKMASNFGWQYNYNNMQMEKVAFTIVYSGFEDSSILSDEKQNGSLILY